MAEAEENIAETTAEPMEQNETVKVEEACKEDSTAADVETLSSDTSNTKPNSTGKYTEEERLKRKEYFNGLNKTRKLAREKQRQNLVKRLGTSPRNYSSFNRPGSVILSEKMSDEEKKMLDFYKIRLSTLRSENELLHKRLVYLVKENMRLLQKGPA